MKSAYILCGMALGLAIEGFKAFTEYLDLRESRRQHNAEWGESRRRAAVREAMAKAAYQDLLDGRIAAFKADELIEVNAHDSIFEEEDEDGEE